MLNEIKEIICNILELDMDELGLDDNLANEHGADSMMALEILAIIEKKFKLIIPEEELANMQTLGAINTIVNKYALNSRTV